MPSIRVMHFGLGPIGAAIVKQVAARPGFKIVGAIDIDPAKLGRDLGEVVGVSKKLGVKVSGDAAKALKSSKPDVVVLCTSSSIKKVLPQIEAIIKSQTPIVSTTEELSYPGYTHMRRGAEDSRDGQEGESRGAWDRRQPGFRDGRAADRADGRVRARRPHQRAPHPGRADPPPESHHRTTFHRPAETVMMLAGTETFCAICNAGGGELAHGGGPGTLLAHLYNAELNTQPCEVSGGRHRAPPPPRVGIA